jgi:hypothetical protein
MSKTSPRSPDDIMALTNQERIDLIRGIPVRDIVSPPGHLSLRSPEAVLQIATAMTADDLGSLASEPILLNVFPREVEDGSPVSWVVHCIDGTHRLAAGLHAGKWRLIGDIPRGMLHVWIEGWGAGDTTGPRPRWIPLEVARASSISDWTDVSDHRKAKGRSAQIRGDIPNYSVRIPKRYRGVGIGEVLKRTLERIG